jgi:hypothetical protein
MDRLLKETRVEERFAERDIRAKVGSDAETLEKARFRRMYAWIMRMEPRFRIGFNANASAISQCERWSGTV